MGRQPPDPNFKFYFVTIDKSGKRAKHYSDTYAEASVERGFAINKKGNKHFHKYADVGKILKERR